MFPVGATVEVLKDDEKVSDSDGRSPKKGERLVIVSHYRHPITFENVALFLFSTGYGVISTTDTPFYYGNDTNYKLVE